jgi:hypothetical protein
VSEMITPGWKVRSFDFPRHRDLEGEYACYVEGFVVTILRRGETFAVGEGQVACFPDCDRYVIRASSQVWGGEREEPRESHFFPPVNGTQTWEGETDYVVAV